MIHTEKQFYYWHKPTSKYVLLIIERADRGRGAFPSFGVDLYLKDCFDPEIMYAAKNVLEETFCLAKWAEDPKSTLFSHVADSLSYSFKTPLNQDEFELRECIITYNYAK